MKFAAIADWAASTTYTVAFMCAQLGVSRAGYYAWRNRLLSVAVDEDVGVLSRR